MDGSLNENAGEFAGMNRFESRKAIIEKLESKGLFVSKNPHAMNLPICSRSGDIIEPLLNPQWYVKATELAKTSLQLVESGAVEIMPSQYKDEWNRWLTKIHDWCISRQLWWGHRIPAYQIVKAGSITDDWVVAHTEQEAIEIAMKKFQLEKDNFTLKQDSDVLDTWFSSGIYPISSFHWPNEQNNMDLLKYYPLNVMETGSDILFFWVARMSMLCTYLTKKHPFEKIYLHPLIRDSKGRKMSKSLGNVVDPLDIINGKTLENLKADLLNSNLDKEEQVKSQKLLSEEFPEGIQECGSDALRFSLAAYTEQVKF